MRLVGDIASDIRISLLCNSVRVNPFDAIKQKFVIYIVAFLLLLSFVIYFHERTVVLVEILLTREKISSSKLEFQVCIMVLDLNAFK